ncbi:Undecaprenyl pyrophosphate synthetase family protein, putative [Theobroma cacao]|uniref:Alkyl transferase n=1 Tax=Theobroma cacao TaxID=3641 RepID=A0A061EQV6_THECC|nr:Undecaprenyl pyrophosphate synthetase family protein, putative [Theobroma cacao]
MHFSLQFSLPPVITALSPRSKSFSHQPHHHRIKKLTSHVPKSPLCSTTECALIHQCKEEEEEAFDGRVEDQTLPLGLRPEALPRHVAVIMDGNRRWARLRDLPVGSGYEAGVRSLRKIVELCCEWGIKVLSVFAFSSDNWFRPKVEVEFLMSLFERGMQEDTGIFLRENIRISVIGDLARLPEALQELIINLEEATKNNARFQLIVAVSYSGHYDVVQACQRLALKAKCGLIEPSDINESLIEQELVTKCTEFPYPDLLIRTSGEFRVSNFMLWQLAYAELFFAQSLWPDFGEAEFLKALLAFQKRQRRYGG